MDFQTLISNLNKRLGLTIESTENACAFEIENVTFLLINTHIDENDQVMIIVDLGAPPPEHLAPLYESMLTANYTAHAVSSGAIFARNPQNGHLTLQRIVPMDHLNHVSVRDRLRTIANEAITWSTLIRDFREGSTLPCPSSLEIVEDTAPCEHSWQENLNAFIRP